MNEARRHRPEPTPAEVARARADLEITRLRMSGLSLYEIGEKLGLHPATVGERLRKTLRKWNRLEGTNAQELGRLEEARLDAALRCLYPMLTGLKEDGSPHRASNTERLKAVEILVRIGERRARLRGLDAPEKRQVEIDMTVEAMGEAELREEARRLGLPVLPTAERLALIGGPLPGPKKVEVILNPCLPDTNPGGTPAGCPPAGPGAT